MDQVDLEVKMDPVVLQVPLDQLVQADQEEHPAHKEPVELQAELALTDDQVLEDPLDLAVTRF